MISLEQRLIDDGFALVDAPTMAENLAPFGDLSDFAFFAASWNDMPRDDYMADGGRYRRRRHAVFAAIDGTQAMPRLPHRPHYQTVEYNTLNGGVARHFGAVEHRTTETESFRTILAFSRALFDNLSPDTSWDIEMHQFRIESGADMHGQPTPEGMHRDGVDYVLVLLIDRQNIASGVTTIHAFDKTLLGDFTLAKPLDAALVHDSKVLHGVTAVEPIDVGRPAYRDVLVLTFRARK